MGNTVFPTLPGLMWDVIKSPRWNTKVQQSVGGKETRAEFFSTPIYKWQLRYELLRASASLELQTLIGFFNARQGKFDSFLFSDPSDNTVSAHGFGVGNAATTAFQLQRTIAGPRTLDWQGPFPVSTTRRTNRLVAASDLTNGAWGTTGGPTLTANTTDVPDPSGAFGASKMIAPASAGVFQLGTGIGVANNPFTGSVWLRTLSGSVSANIQLFDSVAATTPIVTVTPTWQRFAVSLIGSPAAVLGSQARFGIFATSGAGVTLYAYLAQLEDGLTATPGIPTTGATVSVDPAYSPSGADGFEPVLDLNGGPQIVRTDWQGAQLLYPYARRNNLAWSSDFSNAIWVKTNMTVATGVADPSGGTGACTLTASAGVASAIQNLVTSTGILRTNSVWLRRRTGSGVVQIVGADSGVANVTLTSAWQRFIIGGVPSNARFSGVNIATSGDQVDVFGSMQEDAIVAGAYIPTTTIAVTVTDYTLSPSGLVTFAAAPLAGAQLTWSGNYYWRVRFDQDAADFQNFLYQLWEAKAIALVSVK